MSAVLVAATAAAAVWLAMAPPRRLCAPAGSGAAPGDPVQVDTPLLVRLRPVIAGLTALGGYAFFGGALGVAAGLAGGWLCWKLLGDSDGPAAARRREQLVRDLPTGVDLIASCVQAGAAVESALVVVADAIGGPLAEELRSVHHRLVLGVDPIGAWQQLDDPALRPLVAAVVRAHESGAAVSEAVVRLADDLREQARTEVLARASSVEVRAAGPLAACFLPSFLLLGVVPLIASMLGALTLFH